MLMVGLMVSGELFATISTHPVGALPSVSLLFIVVVRTLSHRHSEHRTGPGPRQPTPGAGYHEPDSKRECVPCKDACVWWYRACHAASRSTLYLSCSLLPHLVPTPVCLLPARPAVLDTLEDHRSMRTNSCDTNGAPHLGVEVGSRRPLDLGPARHLGLHVPGSSTAVITFLAGATVTAGRRGIPPGTADRRPRQPVDCCPEASARLRSTGCRCGPQRVKRHRSCSVNVLKSSRAIARSITPSCGVLSPNPQRLATIQ